MKTTAICCCLTTLLIIGGCSDKEPTTASQSNSVSATESYASDIQVSNLVGDWKVDVDGNKAIAKVAGDKSISLTFTTEVGAQAIGAIHGDKIEIPEWKVTGQLTSDRKRIRWSNGISWNK